MLTSDEPGDFAMIVHYQIQMMVGTMQCWTETKEWNIENDKKKSKIEKNETQKTETKENLEVHIVEELGPVQWEIRRIETREDLSPMSVPLVNQKASVPLASSSSRLALVCL